jgi:hypothetical protein
MDTSSLACEFAKSAQPHSWFLVADNLYEQSTALYSQSSHSKTILRDVSGYTVSEWASTNRATFLLAGFALENAIKAFLVYENPTWISNGVLARPLRSHRLVELSDKSALVPWKTRGVATLKQFERGLESWARYPCALSAEGTEAEQNLTPELWRQYLRLMEAYGKKMMALLRKEWSGPHGTGGRFEISGRYLGAT